MNEHGRPALRGHVTAPSADSQPSRYRCCASLGRSGRDHGADVVTRSCDTLSIHVNHISTPPPQYMNEHGRPALRGHVTAPSADSQPSRDRCMACLGTLCRDHAADVVTRSRATLSIHVNHTSTPHNVSMSTGVQHYVDM